ncbi:MAG: FAD-dependent oxidoreductase, partial [Actinomycetaceae bacterium]
MAERAGTAIVVGAGIAGLAAAISLADQGWRVTVLERSDEPREVGAGVALSRNAVAALGGLGIGPGAVAGLGFPTRAAGTWTSDGHPILTIPDAPATREAVGLVGVHRRRLHGALARRAADSGVEVVAGTRVTDLEAGDPDGERAVVAGREADLVVGADGMHSAVRAALFPDARAVYSGFSSWRAIIPRAADETTLRQFWGSRAEVGVMPVHPDETYWYGYVAMPECTELADELAAARRRLTGWAQEVTDLLDRTAPADVLR